MTVRELRDLVDADTILWIETTEEKYLEAGEAGGLSHKYGSCEIKRMFVQHYPSLYAHGITVQI